VTADPALAFLLIKMLTTAGFVIAASLVAERTGPLVAAMVATLPVSAGPVYAFLALDHGDAFIGEAALGSMGANMATTAFSLTYVLAAQRLGTAAALAAAFAAWAPTLLAFKWLSLPFAAMLALALLVFPVIHRSVRPYLAARPDKPPRLAWYALPLRAAFVSLLVASVTTLSFSIGAQWSGFFATFPVVLSTLVIFIQPRIGGPATAAIIASGVLGLMGFAFALCFVHLSAVALGKWPALALGLLICVLWNLALVGWTRQAAIVHHKSS
jgi:hypothetical protein